MNLSRLLLLGSMVQGLRDSIGDKVCTLRKSRKGNL
jgi:hypothetical protein